MFSLYDEAVKGGTILYPVAPKTLNFSSKRNFSIWMRNQDEIELEINKRINAGEKMNAGSMRIHPVLLYRISFADYFCVNSHRGNNARRVG